jgi:hypothetical protein
VTEEQIAYMATDPGIYHGLSQIASEYNDERSAAIDDIYAQIGAEENDDDMAELSELLAQMDKQELTELHDMLAQIEVDDDEADY